MNILYDSQIFELQKWGGISRYFYKLMKNSSGLFNYTLSGRYSENVYAGKISSLEPVSKYDFRRLLHRRSSIQHKANVRSDLYHIRHKEYDIFHPTYYYPAEIPADKMVVATVHDMIHDKFPAFFSDAQKVIEAKRNLVKGADKIIAISENTKRDILDFVPEVEEDKIVVIYHACDWQYGLRHSLPEKMGQILQEKPYLLYTGQRSGYKNFINFIKAAADIVLQYDLNIVCTGNPLNKEEMELVNHFRIDNRVITMFADENELKAIYENALCFVFPSMYEGFGYPILEAFASGCPIAISSTSCFPEIAGDAAEYFDPYDCDSIISALNRLLDSDVRRKDLVNKGRSRLEHFSDEKFESETVAVYRSLLT